MIALEHVSKAFTSHGQSVPAVDDVSLEVGEGELLRADRSVRLGQDDDDADDQPPGDADLGPDHGQRPRHPRP